LQFHYLSKKVVITYVGDIVLLLINLFCYCSFSRNSIREQMEKKPKVIIFDLGTDKILNVSYDLDV